MVRQSVRWSRSARRAVGYFESFFAVTSGIILVVAVNSKDLHSQKIPFFESITLIVAIATVALVATKIFFGLYSRIGTKTTAANQSVEHISLCGVQQSDMDRLHQEINAYRDRTGEKGLQVMLRAFTNQLTKNDTNVLRTDRQGDVTMHRETDYEPLHRVVDIIKEQTEMSGSRVIVKALWERIQHKFAEMFVRIAAGCIKIGRVRHSFLEADETPYKFYLSLWLNDIEYTNVPKDRLSFGFARIPDALSIVFEYSEMTHKARKAIYLVRKILGIETCAKCGKSECMQDKTRDDSLKNEYLIEREF